MNPKVEMLKVAIMMAMGGNRPTNPPDVPNLQKNEPPAIEVIQANPPRSRRYFRRFERASRDAKPSQKHDRSHQNNHTQHQPRATGKRRG